MSNGNIYIIGAGASKEANLPTGFELKSIISKLLNIKFDRYEPTSGDYIITNALQEHVKNPDGNRGDINPYLKEALHIKDALSLAISIDNFIDAHRNNEKLALCGKLSIVRAILSAEKKSLLFFKKDRVDSTINFTHLEKTWYLQFFQVITENCEKDDLEERLKLISLIIFNYDRCIEHFLLHAFIKYYGVTEQEAAKFISYINIYHPYGKVGYLPWQNQSDIVEFGEELNGKRLLLIAKEIKTFTEGTDPDSSDITEIKEKIKNAHRLVFMGFAFHKLNMELLSPENVLPFVTVPGTTIERIKCYATTLGISESDKEVISQQISSLYGIPINTKMVNAECKDFFPEFWRSLSF